MYWYKATNKLIKLCESKELEIDSLESILNRNLELFSKLKYFGLDPEHPDADIVIKNILIYLFGDEYNITVININESNLFHVMFNLWECLGLMVRLYENRIPESLKEIQSQIYNTEKANNLINAKKLIAKDIVNNDLHPDFKPLTEHIDIKLNFLLDNEKYKRILKPADTPPPHFTVTLTENQLLKLYIGLTENEFLPIDKTDTDLKAFSYIFGGNGEPTNFKPLMWIKTNSTTQGKTLNKKSLLNLLEILKIHYSEIINATLLNKLFVKSDGKSIKFTASNYSNGFISEYNNKIIEIVNSAK